MNNSQRVESGQDVIDYFMDTHPDHQDQLIRTQEALADLLTNLRHACKDDGLDFEAAVASSSIHFNMEG